MQKEGLEFDLLTQRFLVHRWKTPLGSQVREQIETAIHSSQKLEPILGQYLLKHPFNIEPHRFPYYPPDAMDSQAFWVLTEHDLRGIWFSDADFSVSASLARKSLNYARFLNCRFDDANLHRTDLSYAIFENCSLNRCIIAQAGGVSTKLINSSARSCNFCGSAFSEANLCGSDFLDAFFGDVFLSDLRVDYLTRFDLKLRLEWKELSFPLQQLPDLYRAIRIAYERAQLGRIADVFLFHEREARRKYVLWPQAQQQKNYFAWLIDLTWSLMSGYGTKPARLIGLGFASSLLYALIYFLFGTPETEATGIHELLSALYFSFTTFATLGYGDLSYGPEHPLLRLLSTSEAWLGAVIIALFVAVVARKLMR